jgi:hypothetical protein
MAHQKSAPALDLTTEHVRPTVKIDSVEYELRILSDFDFVEYHEIDRIGPRLDQLMRAVQAGTAPKKDAAEFAALLTQACEIALLAPTEVIAKLDRFQKLAVFKVFHERLQQELLLTSALLQMPAPVPGAPSTGATPLPASSASTAVTPGRGSRSRSAISKPS